jgi:hypothetical protein
MSEAIIPSVTPLVLIRQGRPDDYIIGFRIGTIGRVPIPIALTTGWEHIDYGIQSACGMGSVTSRDGTVYADSDIFLKAKGWEREAA